MMWKSFVFGLIAGALGSMYICTKLLRPHSCAEVVADGGIMWTSQEEEELESLVSFISFDIESGLIPLLMSWDTSSLTGSDSGKWN